MIRGELVRNLIRISTILILALFVSSCGKKDTVLNMIQAPHGQVIGNQQTGYKLILEEPHDTVIWFSDRPERKAGYKDIKDFLKAWDKGKDSFEKDPPNAVLIIGNSEPIVVELILVSWDENRATFEIKIIEGEISDKSGPVTLFVDKLAKAQQELVM